MTSWEGGGGGSRGGRAGAAGSGSWRRAGRLAGVEEEEGRASGAAGQGRGLEEDVCAWLDPRCAAGEEVSGVACGVLEGCLSRVGAQVWGPVDSADEAEHRELASTGAKGEGLSDSWQE